MMPSLEVLTQAVSGARPVPALQFGQPVPTLAILAALTLLPFAVVMLSSFSKLTVVLSLARSALGTQQAPPSIVLAGLAAVLTAHIMTPTLERSWEAGRSAFVEVGDGPAAGGRLLGSAARAAEPLRGFLL